MNISQAFLHSRFKNYEFYIVTPQIPPSSLKSDNRLFQFDQFDQFDRFDEIYGKSLRLVLVISHLNINGFQDFSRPKD
jgi:hypothetical protein